LPAVVCTSHALGMFVVTEIDAAAIRAQPLRLHLSEMLTVQLSLTENPLNRAGIADTADDHSRLHRNNTNRVALNLHHVRGR
jgi:hypothetical protein